MKPILRLSVEAEQELRHMRDHDAKPYLRERAAALLLIAAGVPAAVVARTRLLRPRDPDTVYHWRDRCKRAGLAGLRLRPGRGRRPAFSRSAS